MNDVIESALQAMIYLESHEIVRDDKGLAHEHRIAGVVVLPVL